MSDLEFYTFYIRTLVMTFADFNHRSEFKMATNMEVKLKQELGTSLLKSTGYSGGGCISEGQSYDTDNGRVFVKINHKSEAKIMFDGEMASLKAILKTSAIKVPRPVKVIELDRGCAFVMEHLEINGLSMHSRLLGEQLADMHLYNKRQLEKLNKDQQTVGKGGEQAGSDAVKGFGFEVQTCYGYLPQVNDWQEDWVTFFTRYRLQHQLDLIEKSYRDKESRELWAKLQVIFILESWQKSTDWLHCFLIKRGNYDFDVNENTTLQLIGLIQKLKIPQFFKDVEIVPALVHGDLWSGNVAECAEGPVIFDPSSFYGHSEFELGIAVMFGEFGNAFYSAYHENIPKAPGFSQRNQLYQLFNYLNHWNHFGDDYRVSSIRIMRDLLK